MRKLSSWAARIAVSAGATAGIVAACFSDVPHRATPLPPREVPPQGPHPEPILPAPMPTADAGSGSVDPVIEASAQLGAAPAEEDLDEDAGVDANGDGNDAGDGGAVDAGASDAGVTDVVDLPPVPDADVPLLPPGLPH